MIRFVPGLRLSDAHYAQVRPKLPSMLYINHLSCFCVFFLLFSLIDIAWELSSLSL